MTVEAELLAAIVAAPADDEPRLVYADALMQRGDPRGELIALQCRIARADAADEPIDNAVLARERELRETHGVLWLAPLREIAEAGYVFRRGFVEHITAWSEGDIDYWRPLAEGETPLFGKNPPPNEPHDRLARIRELAPLLRSVATRGGLLYCDLVPAWSGITTLELQSPRALPEEITRFLGSPRLSSLTRFQITNAEAGDDQGRAWLNVPWSLRHLGFHIGLNVTARPTCDLATVIAENSSLRGLRSLHLGGFPLADLSALAALSELESLALHRNAIEAYDLLDLVAKLPALTTLEIDDDDRQLGDLQPAALLAAAPKLRRLAIRNRELRDEGAKAIAQSPHARALRRLELEQCALSRAGVRALLDSDHLRDVAWWRIVDDNVLPIVEETLTARHTLRYEAPPPEYPREVVEHLPANKIGAIKQYRSRTGEGLADSKMEIERIVEELYRQPSFGFNRAVPRWCRP